MLGRPAVRPSGRPAGRIQNLNVALHSRVIVATLIKLGMDITTMDRYAKVPLLVTSDLYIGHRGSK